MTRLKWFVPRRDGQTYKPFGIDCEDAAPLYGHRGGWNLAGATGHDQPAAQEIAASNRAFWASLDRPAGPKGSSRGDERPPA
ncbi:hypothetical protein AB0B10_25550 [Micromonospora arborensis]|uniref:hypothetical protein n=1 Tax=Micromonospora arborensis TaxID=2116518 RepID=UPI0033DD9E4B